MGQDHSSKCIQKLYFREDHFKGGISTQLPMYTVDMNLFD